MFKQFKFFQLIRNHLGSIFFILFLVTVIFNIYHYILFLEETKKFISKGKRFTASDGQELCLRIQSLEQQTFVQEKECNYK